MAVIQTGGWRHCHWNIGSGHLGIAGVAIYQIQKETTVLIIFFSYYYMFM